MGIVITPAFLLRNLLCLFAVWAAIACSKQEPAAQAAAEQPVITVQPLAEPKSADAAAGSVINSLDVPAASAAADAKDPIAALEQLSQSQSAARPAAANFNNKLVNVAEVPARARRLSSQKIQPGKSEQSQAARRSPLAEIKELYRKQQYVQLTKVTFTSMELPQLYYKASAYFQLAKQAPRRSRKQVEYVRYSKQLYGRIAETTRDAELKARSLLWLAILRWRYPAWSEDLEKQLASLFYIQRKLKATRIYNDALLYTGFIYQSHQRYSKAYRYYRKLAQTSADDWVYDDNIRKFVQPERASRWYLAKLQEQQLTQLLEPSSPNPATPVAAPRVVVPAAPRAVPQPPPAAAASVPSNVPVLSSETETANYQPYREPAVLPENDVEFNDRDNAATTDSFIFD